MTSEIYLNRIRFEHFYNGVLTLDIHHCPYDCIFCFSKGWRYLVTDNLKNGTVHELPLKNIIFNDKEKKIGLRIENEDKDYIIFNFGKSESKNNLIKKKNKSGDCVIVTNPQEIVDKIETVFFKLKKDVDLIRFSGGEPTHPDFIEHLNNFMEILFQNKKLENIKFLVETNGYRFNDFIKGDFEYIRFIDLLKKYKDSKRMHVRISLKNPIPKFYNILTKCGMEENLENAIDFGIFCFKEGIDFHYTLVANYLSVYDLKFLKEKILEKLKNVPFIVDEEQEFFNIFNNIEFERLFYYDTIFKEYMIADKLLENQKFIEEQFKLFLKDIIWVKKYDEMKIIFEEKFTNTHEAYYDKFFERTIPIFDENDGNPFHLDIIQYKTLKTLYKEIILSKGSPKRNLDFLKTSEKNKFNEYLGIQQFWELMFQSRYLLYHNRHEELCKQFEFKNISIINKLPLYPGIFYIFDFWHQAHPNNFIHTLYAEREYMELKISENGEEKEYYVFSINCNPWTHAHTDISRAIPFFIETIENNKELIELIKSNEVVNLESLDVSIIDIRSYAVKYRNFEIIVPFYILKYVGSGIYQAKRTPFLGSIAAFYKESSKDSTNLIYLNYFFWTGIKKKEDKSNYSIEKAFSYLEKFQNVLKIKEPDENWLKIFCFEPKLFILENSVNEDNENLKQVFDNLEISVDGEIYGFLESLSKQTDNILKLDFKKLGI